MSDLIVPPLERIKADVEHIKDWLSKEPHLAHLATAEDEEWLETFLYNNKFSLEKTKYKLENLYSLRSKYPEIFKNRDPSSKDLLNVQNYFKHVLGHTLTKDGIQVAQVKYMGDPGEFDTTAYLKKLFMVMDLLLLDKRNRLSNFTNIMDFKDFRPGHVLKIMSTTGTVSEILSRAYSIRSTAIHFINVPTFAQKCIETVMKFMPEKLGERMQIHSGTNNFLFEAVDEEVVCSDFGGKGPSMAELHEQVQKRLEEAREWFENRGTLCSNEELRPKDSKRAEEMRGSFRKLEVD